MTLISGTAAPDRTFRGEAAAAAHELIRQHDRCGACDRPASSCEGGADGRPTVEEGVLRRRERCEAHLSCLCLSLEQALAPLHIFAEVLKGLVSEVGPALRKEHEREGPHVVSAPPAEVGLREGTSSTALRRIHVVSRRAEVSPRHLQRLHLLGANLSGSLSRRT